MKNMRQVIFPAVSLVCCAATTPALAVDVGSDTHVGGLVFFDVSNISLQNEDKTGKKVDTPPNGFGFDIKRFYLIVDHKFNDVWSANLTTDAQLAAVSLRHRAVVHTADTDFARFPNVRWHNPILK